MVFLLSFGTATHGALNLIYNSISVGGINYNATQLDIWSRSLSNATAQMLLYALLISLAGYFLIGSSRKYLFFISAIPLFHTVLIGGRTIIILFIVSLLTGLLTLLTTRSQNKVKTISLFLVITLSSAIILNVLYSLNIFGLKSTFESSNLYARLFSDYAVNNDMSFFKTSRFDTKIKYLQYAVQYPFGGSNLHSLFGSYAHDAFLDTYDAVGILPTVLWIVCLVRSSLRFFKYTHTRSISFPVKVMLRCLYFCMFVCFFAEPIIQGGATIVACFFMIDGALTRALSQSEAPLMPSQV